MDTGLIVALVLGAMTVPVVFYFRPDWRKQFVDFVWGPFSRDEDPFSIGDIPERDDRPHVLIINHDTSWQHLWNDEKLEESLNQQGFRVTQIRATPEELADLKERYSCLGHEFTKIILNGGSVSRVYDILEKFQHELVHA